MEAGMSREPLSEVEERAVRTLYRAFSEKKPELLNEVLSPDWQDIPLAPGQGPGPEGLKVEMQHFFQAFPDLHIAVHELFGIGGRCGVRAEIVATHAGAFLGVEPTGKKVSVVLHEFHALRDGRLTHTWHLEDWFGMLRQVGAWPPK